MEVGVMASGRLLFRQQELDGAVQRIENHKEK